MIYRERMTAWQLLQKIVEQGDRDCEIRIFYKDANDYTELEVTHTTEDFISGQSYLDIWCTL